MGETDGEEVGRGKKRKGKGKEVRAGKRRREGEEHRKSKGDRKAKLSKEQRSLPGFPGRIEAGFWEGAPSILLLPSHLSDCSRGAGTSCVSLGVGFRDSTYSSVPKIWKCEKETPLVT